MTQFTHTLGGRIRVMQVERIDKATGRSTRWSPLQLATDGGLRFEVGTVDARWFVYSY